MAWRVFLLRCDFAKVFCSRKWQDYIVRLLFAYHGRSLLVFYGPKFITWKTTHSLQRDNCAVSPTAGNKIQSKSITLDPNVRSFPFCIAWSWKFHKSETIVGSSIKCRHAVLVQVGPCSTLFSANEDLLPSYNESFLYGNSPLNILNIRYE